MHDIENYMLEEHWELRQAATELMCNLTCYSETVKWFEDEKYDRLKVRFLFFRRINTFRRIVCVFRRADTFRGIVYIPRETSQSL